MASVDLIFQFAPTSGAHADLVFGDTGGASVDVTIDATLPGLTLNATLNAANDATVSATLPALTLVADIRQAFTATVNATLPGLTLDLSGIGLTGFVYTTDVDITLPPLTAAILVSPAYFADVAITLPQLAPAVELDFDVNVARPTVGQTSARHQIAKPLEVGESDLVQTHQSMPSSTTGRHQDAAKLFGNTRDNIERMDGVKVNAGATHSTADKLRAQVGAPHQEMYRDRRQSISTSHEEAIRIRTKITTSSQDRYRDRRPSLKSAHQTAQALRTIIGSKHNVAIHVRKAWGVRHQEAMRPPAGIEAPVVPPVGEPCYTPSPHLLFAELPGNSNLLFICENHITPPDHETVVVPIRSVYIVINNVTLRRVDGDIYLPALSMSLSIDVDSWTWSFSATLPPQSLADVRSNDGSPVELEASINGNLYRLLAENVSRTRQFGDATISINGRGKNAILAAPYAPVLTFANSIERSAQQLMADVLQFNGVPLGWDIDWQLDDWLVPAGVFNAQGSYIDGLNAIVGAAGAYIQPHPTDQQFRALLRYPVAPWDWASTVTPDFDLPSAVTTQEGIEWLVKPDYNRVYVSGQQQGILARVTRAGTAGDLPAPMVTDPLITQAAAGRQRGLSILANTGRQAMVSLRLPVLNSTGIITPGAFVRYTDGADEKLGIVRSTSVDCSFPEVWQQIQVETHE